MCLISNRKLSTLSRIKKYLDFNKMRIPFKAFFEPQFKYCPLTWIFHSRSTNNRIYHNLSQTIFSELFMRNNSTYNMRSKCDFVIPQVSTVFKGFSSINYYSSIIWNLVPEKIRYTDSLESFKSKIRTWSPKNCPCHICRNYIPNVRFLETFE